MVSVPPGFRSVARFCIAVGALAGAACSDGTGPNASVHSLEVVGGINQSARINTSLPVPISIRAMSLSRHPVRNVLIFFSSATYSAGATFEPHLVYTNKDGIATTTWTFGASPGTNTLEACTNPLITPRACTTVTATATE